MGAWDATALVQLKALGRELAQQGCQLGVSSLSERAHAEVPLGLLVFADLDRALEWAEAAILDERPATQRLEEGGQDWLGVLGDGMSPLARADLEPLVERIDVGTNACLFGAGDSGREIYFVRSGLITMATAWPPSNGMRLASIGRGMPFGEMAFLSGEPRSAYAGSDGEGAQVARLAGEAFDKWSTLHPGDALVFMRKLALVGTTRLAATTRQLRAILE